MNIRFQAAVFFLIAGSALADDPPAIPARSIAERKELLFSDDFEGAEPAKVWHKVVPTFVVEKGVLKGTQTGSPPSRPTPPCMDSRFQPRTASSRCASASRAPR